MCVGGDYCDCHGYCGSVDKDMRIGERRAGWGDVPLDAVVLAEMVVGVAVSVETGVVVSVLAGMLEASVEESIVEGGETGGMPARYMRQGAPLQKSRAENTPDVIDVVLTDAIVEPTETDVPENRDNISTRWACMHMGGRTRL